MRKAATRWVLAGALAASGIAVLFPPSCPAAAPTAPTPAPDTPAEPSSPPTFDVLLYSGQFVDTILVHILQFRKRHYRHSFIDVAGVSRPLGIRVGPFALEGEANLAVHRGLQRHTEVNALVIARLGGLGSAAAPVSLAVGEGLSLASAEPPLEREDNEGDSNPLLLYIMVEADVLIPGLPHHSRAMLRIHHRSGVFGTFCPRVCGSNFVTTGVKVAF